MAVPVVLSDDGRGIPVQEAAGGLPVDVMPKPSSGRGIVVTLAVGGLPVQVVSGSFGGGGVVVPPATRAYTPNDAPTKPTLWIDARDSSTMTLDGNGRVTQINCKIGTCIFTAPSATAPLYQPTGFNGALPALKFDFARKDVLVTSNFNGPAQPCTVVHVWQEPASGQNPYACVFDYRNTGGGDGGRVSVFNFYNSTTAMSVFNGSTAGTRMGLPNAYNQINIMVVEYNGASSRIFLNGVTTAFTTQVVAGSTIFGTGMTLGGKANETYSLFNGVVGSTVVYPGVFTGDDWDRVTQGTMWDWGQQANIATGATYKNAAPTVSA